MAEVAAATGPLPVVSFLKIPKQGDPYLEGQRCTQCDAVFLGERSTCSSCGARAAFEAKKLANTGTLYVYTIVHRSFPGVEVPYVSAVVDLDGGGTLKGNLINIAPDPDIRKAASLMHAKNPLPKTAATTALLLEAAIGRMYPAATLQTRSRRRECNPHRRHCRRRP